MPALLKSKGLYTYGNELNLPEGALITADNVIIDKNDVLAPRRGFAEYGDDLPATNDRVKQMMDYKDVLIRHYDSTLQFDDGTGTFTAFSGTFAELETGLRIKYIESNGNFYFTTTNGIQKISATSSSEFVSTANYIVRAGGPKALHVETTTSANLSGFLSEESKVAYRTVWGYKDKNSNLILGSPSERAVVSNSTDSVADPSFTGSGLDDLSSSGVYTSTVSATYKIEIDGTGTPDTFKWYLDGVLQESTVSITGSAQTLSDGVKITFAATTGHTLTDYWEVVATDVNKEVDLTLTVPNDVTSTDYFYQIYRTQNISVGTGQTMSDIDPGDEMNLIYELPITSAQITAGEVTFTDNTPEAFRANGAPLYTNPISGDGILQANEKPPVAKDMDVFRESVFYGNTSTINRKQVSILSTARLTKSNTTFTGSGLDDATISGVYTEETTKAYSVKIDSADSGLSYAIAMANDLKAKYNAHCADTGAHTTAADAANTIGASDATNLATLITLVTEMLTDYDAHDGDAELGAAWSYHAAQEASDHSLASTAAPTTLAECIVDLNDFLVKYNAHDADDTAHGSASNNTSTYIAATANDTFKWSDDGEGTWTTLVQMTGSAQTLSYGFSVTFNDTTGHTVDDKWSWSARESYFLIGDSTALTTYMFTDTTDLVNNKVAVSTSTSVSQSIDETARELVKVINRDATGLVYAYYLSGENDLPGIILFESRNLSDPTFYLGTTEDIEEDINPAIYESTTITALSLHATAPQITTSTAHGYVTGDVAYIDCQTSTPTINGAYTVTKVDATKFTISATTTGAGTSGTTFNGAASSDNETVPNRLYFSKTGQPEAVPLLNYMDVGSRDKEIKRVIALRDNLFVLKEDGVFIVSGSTPANFSPRILDNSVFIVAPDTAVVLNNEIYCLTSQGVATISDTGVGIISHQIENLISDVTNHRITNYKTASFGLAYDSDRAYHIWLPTIAADTYATQCYRYNIYNKAWTRWDKNAMCAIINPSDDRMYIGPGDQDAITQERKTGDRTDYADLEYTKSTSTNGIVDNVIEVNSLTNIAVGDVLYQKQWVTISKYNRLLKKLDLDQGLNYTSFHTDLQMSTGDDIYTKLDELIALIDTYDTGLTYTSTNPSTFEECKDEWNYITGQLNNASSSSVYNDYSTLSSYIEYESIITSIDVQFNKVTLAATMPFYVGGFTLYKGYESKIEWAPQDFGDPTIMKQISEGSVVFDGNQFYSAILGYASDMSKAFTEIPFNGQGSGTFGMTNFGSEAWGGEGDDKPFRTLIPRQKQRCRYLSCRFRHLNAREQYSILGITLTMRPLSTRAYRTVEGN